MMTIRGAIVAILLAAAWPQTGNAEDGATPNAGGLFALGVNLPRQSMNANSEKATDPGVTGSITQSSEASTVGPATPKSAIAAISIEPDAVGTTASEGEPAKAPAIEAARSAAPSAPIAVRDATSNVDVQAARLRAQREAKARVARRADATTGKLIGRALDQPGVEILNSPLKSPDPWF